MKGLQLQRRGFMRNISSTDEDTRTSQCLRYMSRALHAVLSIASIDHPLRRYRRILIVICRWPHLLFTFAWLFLNCLIILMENSLKSPQVDGTPEKYWDDSSILSSQKRKGVEELCICRFMRVDGGWTSMNLQRLMGGWRLGRLEPHLKRWGSRFRGRDPCGGSKPGLHVDGDVKEVEEGEVVKADETDLLPPPIVQLGDRSQKRSSGRVTMPSSRLHGYELY